MIVAGLSRLDFSAIRISYIYFVKPLFGATLALHHRCIRRQDCARYGGTTERRWQGTKPARGG